MLETVQQVPSLVDRIAEALKSSPHTARQSQSLRIEPGSEEGHIRLVGRVQTFFEKQMAQETIRTLDGVSRIENLVEVTW
jgi:osmotically-inducible protein OsmY